MADVGDWPSEKEIVNTRRALIDIMPMCALCKTGGKGHQFKGIAQTSEGNGDSSRLMRLFEAVKSHQRSQLIAFQDFDWRLNSVAVYALKCTDSKCSLIVVLFPFELYEPNILLFQEPVPLCDGPCNKDYWGPL